MKNNKGSLLFFSIIIVFILFFAIYLVSERAYRQKYSYPMELVKSLVKSKINTRGVVGLTNTEVQRFSEENIQQCNLNSNNDLSVFFQKLQSDKFDYGIFLGVNDEIGRKVLNLFSLFFSNHKVIMNEFYTIILYEKYKLVKPINIFDIIEFNLKKDSLGYIVNRENEFSFNFNFLPSPNQIYIIDIFSAKINNEATFPNHVEFVVSYKYKNGKEKRESIHLNKNSSANFFILNETSDILSIDLFLWNPYKERFRISTPKINTYVSRETYKNSPTYKNH